MGRIKEPGPLAGRYPITQCLYGAATEYYGVIDLGEHWPSKIIPIADLRTNASYKVSVLNSPAAYASIGTAKASAVAGGNFQEIGTTLNAALELVSSAADTRTVTIYGTITGTNIVATETVTLNGATFVTTTRTNWGFPLGIKASASSATLTITLRTVADATITTIGTDVTTSGITEVTGSSAQNCFGLPIAAALDASGTQTTGIIGINAAGVEVYDAITQSTTTLKNGRQGLILVTHLLTGPVPHPGTADDRHITLKLGHLSWQAGEPLTDLGSSDKNEFRVSHRYLHWCLANGTTLTAGGENDWLKIEAAGLAG